MTNYNQHHIKSFKDKTIQNSIEADTFKTKDTIVPAFNRLLMSFFTLANHLIDNPFLDYWMFVNKELKGAPNGQKSFRLSQKLKQFRTLRSFSFSVVKY